MTTLQKQIKHINNNLFAARMENIIQYMYEDELEKQVAKVFHRMRKGILKNLKEYYSPDIMVNAHMDLILAPIHESHKKYYDTIMKYKLREHRKGQVQGRRLVKRAKQYAKTYSKNYFGAVKADSTIPMSSIIQKDKLFATSDYSADQMRNKTFMASENTLARVDKDINKIITDGYQNGWGINDVASNIEKRFNQLETWEARRIARTEIHGSHMQGIMQSYEEMGVEYTQWASAHDSRTRDTHSALDGEIIPFGGVYSNGLRYPGDTSGPISEWINCRCGNIPWFCPPGMMVPVGMSHFRESDLIPLGYYDKPGVMESLQKEPVFDETRFANLKTNEEIADFFGYEYIPKGRYYESIDAKTFEFYDKENDVYVRFFRNEKYMCKNIDFTNSGKAEYDLKEVLRIYDETHPNLKVGLDDIEFLRMPNSPGGDAGRSHVRVFDENIMRSVSKRGGIVAEVEPLEHTLDHELGHIYSDTFLKKGEFTRITDPAEKIAGKLKKAGDLDTEYQLAKGLPKQNVSYYAEKNAQEEFAEIVAQTSSLKRGKNVKVTGEKIKRPDSSSYSGFRKDKKLVTEVKEANPHRFDLVEDLLDHPEKLDSNWEINARANMKRNREHFNEFLKEEQSILRAKPAKGYDKYALTETEEARLKELTIKKEKEGGLKFLDRIDFEHLADRKEFNEMWNKILHEGGDPTDYFAIHGAEGVRYEKLFKQFKNWEPLESIEIKPIEINKKQLFKDKNAFKLTSEEKKIYKQAKENTHALSDAEDHYYNALRDKIELNRLHKELIEKGLDDYYSENYIKLYSKYQKEWNLPDLSLDLKFSTGNYRTFVQNDYYKNATEFTLTKKEADELYKLEKKQLIFGDDALSKKELKTIEELQTQQRFVYLNNINQTDKGLDYENTVEFKKLYKSLKTKLSLDKSVLEQPLSNYDSKIPLDKNPKNFKKFKGTTDDGLLPNGENISDYFTKDAREMTIREQDVADRWLGKDYKAFTNFEVDCERDVKKFEKWIYDMAKAYKEDNSLKYYEYYYEEVTRRTGRISKAEAKRLAESIAHDVPVLDDILNNQLKEGMTLWRVQEHHNLTSTNIGDIMELPNFRATAISKNGALWFSKTNAKEMKYLIEIEAPAGTKGAYLAPIKQGQILNPESPGFNEYFANEMEFLLKKCKVELVKFGGKPVKGAMGEDLIPIKLRVVGYK